MIRDWLKRLLLLDLYAELAAARAQLAEWRARLAEAELRHETERKAWKTEREELLLRLLGSPLTSRGSNSDTGSNEVALGTPRIASPMARLRQQMAQRNTDRLKELQHAPKAPGAGLAGVQIGTPTEDEVEVVDGYLRAQAQSGQVNG
jgi:hypothetical protein